MAILVFRRSNWGVKKNKVRRRNLEHGVTWNETLLAPKKGALRETLWGVVGGKSTYFLVVSCRVPGSNLTGRFCLRSQQNKQTNIYSDNCTFVSTLPGSKRTPTVLLYTTLEKYTISKSW